MRKGNTMREGSKNNVKCVIHYLGNSQSPPMTLPTTILTRTAVLRDCSQSGLEFEQVNAQTRDQHKPPFIKFILAEDIVGKKPT